MSDNRNERLADAIAIIGVAGRYPGARDIAEFWRNICSGRDTISHFDLGELEDSFTSRERGSPTYVPARSVLEGVDRFDAAFFGMKPREAELTDPQQRLFLEICWEAFEDAGYTPASNPLVGVFAGASLNTYFLRHVLQSRASVDDFTSQFQVGRYSELLGALNDFVSTRVSYKLGLTGPSLSVATTCSTSLTAVTLACQSLLMQQCDMALAGGVSITFPQRRGYIYSDGGMAAPDGVCRPFDKDAAGTVFGHGAGVVLLKRYEEAVRDRDNIYAVILGYGVNNDGAGKVGFTAPSLEGQASAMAAAYAMADVDPATITYVEAHGTATPLGDPIEVAALASLLGPGGPGALPCHVGSVKGNVGHLDAAAGVTGLIKAALALRSRQIPPIAHFREPNPRFDLAGTRFVFDERLSGWEAGEVPRRAAVNALGVGGTNAHVVLEEAPSVDREAGAPATRTPHQVLRLSARSAAALAVSADNLAAALSKPTAPALQDVSFTLREGRTSFAHRLAVAAATHEDAVVALRAAATRAEAASAGVLKPPRVVFMFPGQGTQYPGMARELYDNAAEFRADVDRGLQLASGLLGKDLRPHLFPATSDDAHGEPIRSTVLAQPALFIIEHALASQLIRLGVTPSAMVGHSLGEFVAATLAGVISYEDALTAIVARARLMSSLPGGAMLAVRLPDRELEPLLPADADIAAINGNNLCVASGPIEAIEQLENLLAEKDIGCRRLHTSHAFHSVMMDPAVPELRHVMRKVGLSAPRIPIASSVTGSWLTAEEATFAEYWARHCRATVRFADALATVSAEGGVLIEVGPGATLTSLARQALSRQPDAIRKATIAVQTLPGADDQAVDPLLAVARATIWQAGIDVSCHSLGSEDAMRVSLPTYPYERKRFFLDVTPGVEPRTQVGGAGIVAPAIAEPRCDANEAVKVDTKVMPKVSVNSSSSARSFQHREKIARGLTEIMAEVSGEELSAAPRGATFLELGFDSLMLGQIAQRLNRTYETSITFRQLMSAYYSIDALTDLLVTKIAPDPANPDPQDEAVLVTRVSSPPGAAAPSVREASLPAALAPGHAATASGMEALFRDQLAAMQQVISSQIALMSGQPFAATAPVAVPQSVGIAPSSSAQPGASVTPPPDRFSTFIVASNPGSDGLSPPQRSFIHSLSARLEAKMPGSKAYAQRYRKVLADPRAASAFDLRWKELVYPIVCDRAKGSRIWDVDGNSYVDVVNGFGQTAFGHNPPFIQEALARQLKDGFPIGPQANLAGEVTEMICEMTGNERATFCNTGSEAVMAAMRVARAVTGRDRIVFFAGAYHGQFDEVLAKQGRQRSLPIAPGIPASSLGNIVILDYGASESIEWIRSNIDDIAAVIVEPVQSRRPSFRPREFLASLRGITQNSGTALVFDEVVTGFRVHDGGMQAVYGIRADMATYGKVLGGGMPIGVLAGKASFLDALDGGQWQFGDDSVPEVAPTFFAGTFVRHPLTLAATRAVLTHLRAGGRAELDVLGRRTEELTGRLNADLERIGMESRFEQFASWMYFTPAKETPLASLFFPHVRLLGVHAQEGFPWFMTTAHSAADFEQIADSVRRSAEALVDAGIMTGKSATTSVGAATLPEETSNSAAAAVAPEVLIARPSAPMREVYLAAQMDAKASTAFNEGLTLTLHGDLDVDAIRASCADVVARHPALRASLGATGESVHITPAAEAVTAWSMIDASTMPDPEAHLAEIVAQDQSTPFDLENGPLIRMQLVRLAPSRHALVVCGHHIVFDGWSAGVLLHELAELYNARKYGRPPALQTPAPLGRALRDIAGANTPTEQYWLSRFETTPDPLELPTDRPRPARKSFAGATVYQLVERGLQERIKSYSKRIGVTSFATLLSGLQVVLSRLTGQTDICIAVPVAGQQLDDSEALVGHLVNFLPVRLDVDLDAAPEAHIRRVRDTLLEAYEHQDYTLGTLVERLGVPRQWDRTPLVDIQFNLESEVADLGLSGLASAIRSNPKSAVNFDLFFNLVETADGIRVEIDYATDLFDEATVRRWFGHLVTLLDGLARDDASHASLSRVPVLTAKEIAWLRDEVNQTAQRFPSGKTVGDLISERAAATPAATALVHAGRSTTYAELESRSTAIAHELAGSLSSQAARIAVAVDRSSDLVTILLGIWKAGHIFVPLDPSHPLARLGETMRVGAISAVVASDRRILDAAPEGAVRIDQRRMLEAAAQRSTTIANAPTRAAAAEGPAYVIFTSGSTGSPKGVEVGHRALTNFMTSMAREPGMTDRDKLLAVTTVCFDISILELLLPLVVGGRVVIADRSQVLDGFELVDLIKDSGATVMQATPSLWRMVLEAGFLPSIGLRMFVGGEPLPRDLADDLLSGGGELWNLYGPTETTIWSAVDRVSRKGAISIGGPIANTSLIVVDARGSLAPIGVAGELLIGGSGLANGYLGRPDLTGAAYVDLSIEGAPTSRYYRTGDIAVRLPDGRLILKGRRDQQIKLRGFRIELEEIEKVLMDAEGVALAAVGVVRDLAGTERLAAYIVPKRDAVPTDADLVRHARMRLPEYMVPSLCHRLPSMPMTANGKLDRKKLTSIGVVATELSVAADPAKPSLPTDLAGSDRGFLTPLELKLTAAWKSVLDGRNLSRDDDFFALGIDSLRVFRFVAELRRDGIAVSAQKIFHHPTIARLSAHLAAAPTDEPKPAAVPDLANYRSGQRRIGRAR